MTPTLLRPDPAERKAISLPRHRAIVALDIEQSTSRPDPIKAELRHALYDLFEQALRSAGICRRHRDRFTDRGDGLLALIHPVDQVPKALLLNRAVPALSKLLADYNADIPPTVHLHRQLRVRVVVHAGEVNYDANGCFGEALDIAFRLLDAPSVKKTLQAATGPLTLVVSEDIYRTVVRHAYDGIDQHSFRPLVRIHIAGNHYTGWIQIPQDDVQLNVAEINRDRYTQSALDASDSSATPIKWLGLPPETRADDPDRTYTSFFLDGHTGAGLVGCPAQGRYRPYCDSTVCCPPAKQDSRGRLYRGHFRNHLKRQRRRRPPLAGTGGPDLCV